MSNYKSKVLQAACMLSVALLATSCFPEQGQDGGGDESSQVVNLSVSASVSQWQLTRSTTETVPLPIRYYLFDSDGACADLKTVDDASTAASFSVERGVYTIYALCGETDEAPTKDAATQGDFVCFVANSDICLGSVKDTVTSYGSEQSVQISVNHIFAKVSLSVTDVPSTVSAISVTFGSLYNSVSLDGEYSGSADITKDLSASESASTTWQLSECYAYPCSSTSSMPITLKVTSTDGMVQTISTTTSYVLSKSKNLSLTAAFNSLNNVTPGVTIGEGWQESSGTVDLSGGTTNGGSITGGGSSDSNSGNDSGSGGSSAGNTTSASYTVGQEYSDTKALVLSAETNQDGSTTLTLVGSKVANIKLSNLSAALANYCSNSSSTVASGLSWYLPSETEWTALTTKYTAAELSTLLTDISGATQSFSTGTSFIVQSGSNYRAYSYATSGSTVSSTSSDYYYCIPFAKYTFK